jgi:ribosome biogenesis GTPase / thiamine phosphate phosphatase
LSRFQALPVARVVAAHGRHAFIETADGKRMQCHLRGRKSDLVVGDLVRWQNAGDEGVIEAVEARRNLLFRQDAWRTKSFAANLDQILLLVAGEPVFSESQLTRALIAAESAGIPALIGLNKIDKPSAATARERLQPYRDMGVQVLEFALKADPQGALALLQPLLQQKVTLALGPSGTGKSTLINLLAPHAQAQVGEISQALNSGRHTTTSTLWYWLDTQRRGALIDSPGFQEFGLRHIDAAQLATLMPDLRARLGQCRFYNCMHRHEPGCGVRVAVEHGDIAAQRYRLYAEILDELTAR